MGLSTSTAALACSVRGCGQPLVLGEHGLVCTTGHRFDLARSGYANLLQPQDSRARSPGDSKEVVQARRALLDGRFAAALERALLALLTPLVRRGGRLLDLGAGEGHFTAKIGSELGLEAIGLDISAEGMDAAAKRYPKDSWIVANADRRLPVRDGSIDVCLSITGRRPRDEIARVLAPEGVLCVVVPAGDDLAELRASVLGAVHQDDRMTAVQHELAPFLVLAEKREARDRIRLDAAGLSNLAAATYRLARSSESERLASLTELEVTTSHAIGLFRRPPPSPF